MLSGLVGQEDVRVVEAAAVVAVVDGDEGRMPRRILPGW